MKQLTGMMLLFVCGWAWAIPVTWTLNDVTLAETISGGTYYGATVTGSFTYDADTNTYSNVSVLTGPGYPIVAIWYGDLYTETLSPNGFNPVLSASSDNLTINSGGFGSVFCGFAFCESNLYLLFASSLTNAGGTVNLVVPGINTVGSREDLLFSGGGGIVSTRFITSGLLVGVAAVPVPAAVWLFGSALAGLSWISRKRVVRYN